MDDELIIKELSKKYGYLEYMVDRYFKLFGKEQTIKLLEANEAHFFPSIRLNNLKIDPLKLKRRLEKKGFQLKNIPWTDYGFWITKSKYPLGATPEYLLGYYYIQQAVSMIPAQVLDPSPEDIIMDMCAAPGGKTTHIAQLMKNEGVILAFDINPKRMKSLRSNLERCGVKNTIGFNMDALEIEQIGIKADKILLDAPCTGEGLICFDPTRKKSRNLEDISFCSDRQKNLLRVAIKCVKKGGIIIYSTCSIAPEENEFVINSVLKDNKVEILDLNIKFGKEGLIDAFGSKLDPNLIKCKRFYPHFHRTEGYFICKMRKR
ncbi:MAG: NOL1/NOP2/sun family putative RNA methylase [Candidatus Hodarchaeota archaeon]